MLENWKSIVGFEGLYEISDLGRVKSLISNGRILRVKPNSRYWEVKLRKEGRSYMKYVHTAMLEAFVGPRPEGMECRHLDGDPENNQLYNLAWGTHLQNQRDAIQHGTFSRGIKHWEAIQGSVRRQEDGRFVRLT